MEGWEGGRRGKAGEGRGKEQREGRREAEKQATEEEAIRRKKVHVHVYCIVGIFRGGGG